MKSFISLKKPINNKNAPKYWEDETTLFNTIDIDTIKTLIARGHNVNEIRREDGATPLFSAVKKNAFEAVKELIAQGANPIAHDKTGKSPLDVALSSTGFDGDIVKLLIEKSAYQVTKTDQPRVLIQQAEIAEKIQEIQKMYEKYMSSKYVYNADNLKILRNSCNEELNGLKSKYRVTETENKKEESQALEFKKPPLQKMSSWEKLVEAFNSDNQPATDSLLLEPIKEEGYINNSIELAGGLLPEAGIVS